MDPVRDDDPEPAAGPRPDAPGRTVTGGRGRLATGAPLPVLALAALLGGWAAAQLGREGGPGDDAHGAAAALARPGATATVERVLDGDTVRIAFRDGGDRRTATVRYLGVDTPESVHPRKPVQCFGIRASHANKRWASGKRVRLTFDRERVDPYGRLLAAVTPVGARRPIGDRLMALGYARVLTIAPNGASAPRLTRLQAAARRADRGLWGACPHRLPWAP